MAGPLLGGVLLALVTPAGADYFAVPSLAAAAIYDDNLFFSPSDPQHDRFWRLSPALEAGYRTEPLTLRGLLTVDAERYTRHPELDSNRAREHAALDYLQRRTPRLTLAADASYTRTESPGELSPRTGLEFARARAERVALHPSLAWQFDRRSLGTAGYRFTRDELSGGVGSDTHLVEFGVDRRLSRRDTVGAGYRYHWFTFDGDDSDAHTLLGSWTRRFTPQTVVTLTAGPRFSHDAVDPEIAASLRHAMKYGDVSFEYGRTETTVIGLAGTATTEFVGAHASLYVGPAFELRLAPSLTSTAHGALQADVFLLDVDIGYRLTRLLSLFGSYAYHVQRGRIDVPGDERITRNVFLLGLLIRAPDRGEASSPRTRARLPPALDREWLQQQTAPGAPEEP